PPVCCCGCGRSASRQALPPEAARHPGDCGRGLGRYDFHGPVFSAALPTSRGCIPTFLSTMNATSWLSRSVGRPRPAADEQPPQPASKGAPPERSTHERLQATLRRAGEALSPRMLRRLLEDLQAVAAERVSEIEAGRRA